MTRKGECSPSRFCSQPVQSRNLGTVVLKVYIRVSKEGLCLVCPILLIPLHQALICTWLFLYIPVLPRILWLPFLHTSIPIPSVVLCNFAFPGRLGASPGRLLIPQSGMLATLIYVWNLITVNATELRNKPTVSRSYLPHYADINMLVYMGNACASVSDMPLKPGIF